MRDSIELLSESLIDQHRDLALEVLAASSRLGLALGWHYVLDLIWLLRDLDLPPGATVLDAGAGWGLAQFLFADRGLRVISVDMSARQPRAEFQHLYNFECIGNGAAIRLYERLGFRVMGRRPKYYADNGEDALLMGLVVTMP